MSQNSQTESKLSTNDIFCKISCYLGWVIEGIVVNFIAILFPFFHTQYGIQLGILALIALFIFLVQLVMDIVGSLLVEKVGYKAIGIFSTINVTIGLVLLAFLPRYIDPLTGIIISSLFMSMGGGIMETVVTPVIQNLPSKNESFETGIGHGMYSLGSFLIILISFLFFINKAVADFWVLSIIFAIIPFITLFIFIFSSYPKIKITPKTKNTQPFFKMSIFWLLCFLMLFAGAIEVSISQWAPTYAELGLNVTKPYGDIYGAGFFALAMGITRIIYAFLSKKINVKYLLLLSGIISVVGYLLTSIPNNTFVNFIGTIIVGIGVAPMWPGIASVMEKHLSSTGKIYALLALFGDIGCSLGSYLIGLIASGLSLKVAVLIATIFPAIYVLVSFFLIIYKRKDSSQINN